MGTPPPWRISPYSPNFRQKSDAAAVRIGTRAGVDSQIPGSEAPGRKISGCMVLCLLLSAAAPSTAAAQQKGRRGTAGADVRRAWGAIWERYPDAVLLGISGSTGADGTALCDPRDPMTDGWRYRFYSASQDAFFLMGGCKGSLAGPLRELRARESLPENRRIEGQFIDSDRALALLKESGISLDPSEHRSVGKRPFSLRLFKALDSRFETAPVFWKIQIGADEYAVNAATQKLLSTELVRDQDETRGGAITSTGPKSARAAGLKGLKGGTGKEVKTAQPKGYTAKADLNAVRDRARSLIPGATLMGIEGLANTSGALRCSVVKEGWAYYYYWPKTRSIETIFACRGQVTQSQSVFIPVNLSLHQAIGDEFVDSDSAVKDLFGQRKYLVDEGTNRQDARAITLRLLRYRNTPFHAQRLWTVTLVWEITVGADLYYVDGKTGKFIGERRAY